MPARSAKKTAMLAPECEAELAAAREKREKRKRLVTKRWKAANREKLLGQTPADLIKTHGDRDDPFACFAEIYQRR